MGRPLEPWLDIPWPLPAGRGREAPSPRAAVAAAEIAVVDAFPDRARELLVPLTRISSASVLAEAVTWESLTTTRADARPFNRVEAERVAFENVEQGFQQANREGRAALLESICEERAASLLRRRVRLRAATLDGGRILLTRLTTSGSAELPLSAFWLELVTLDERTQRGGPVDCLVSWLPATHLPAAGEAIERGAPHAWSEDVADRWDVQPWRTGWVR